MLKLEELQRGFGYLTNEMLEGLIEWWQLPPEKYEKDLILPRLLEERLNRMELDYDSTEMYLSFLTKEAQELNLGYEVHNKRRGGSPRGKARGI